jgi:hypothetical protein
MSGRERTTHDPQFGKVLAHQPAPGGRQMSWGEFWAYMGVIAVLVSGAVAVMWYMDNWAD